jgi:F-type H+-transporting ATPase subunit epsilon
MSGTLRLQIVTPDATAYSDLVEWVILEGVEGQLTILPKHTRFITKLVPGQMTVRRGGQDQFLAVGEGLIVVTGDRVSIVTDMAVRAEDIDEANAEEARQRAAARLREKESSEEVATINAALARALAQLHVKRRRHA